MKLWLLRHARVTVEAGICYGVSDLPADPIDTQQAAQRFADLPATGSRVCVSPSSRTLALATALQALRPDLQAPEVDPRLHEMNFGEWERQPWSSIPRQALDAWTADFAHHRFGGQESTQEVIDRVAQALEDTRAHAASDTIWVTHAGVIRAVHYLQAHGHGTIQWARDWPMDAPAMGDWVCVEPCVGAA